MQLPMGAGRWWVRWCTWGFDGYGDLTAGAILLSTSVLSTVCVRACARMHTHRCILNKIKFKGKKLNEIPSTILLVGRNSPSQQDIVKMLLDVNKVLWGSCMLDT